MNPPWQPSLKLFADHPTLFDDQKYVYPVVSRRCRGVSVGINLNPDKICNFDCPYCQVDRSPTAARLAPEFLNLSTDLLLAELEQTLAAILSGELYNHPRFERTPPEYRRLNDIAFAGDGEPTTYRHFDRIVAEVAEVRRRLCSDDVKLLLITNASQFHRPTCARGLRVLDQNHGEIWAKLDAGTPGYYQQVNRSTIPFEQILTNITLAACERPLVIQTLFMRLDGQPPCSNELEAYCARLQEIVAHGGQLRLVQIYTVARKPAEATVTPLSADEVDTIVELVQRRTGLCVAGYP